MTTEENDSETGTEAAAEEAHEEQLPVAAAAAAPAKKTAEEWAAAKKMLPQIIEQPVVGRGGMRPGKLNEKYSAYAEARAAAGWPVGAELTEQEFDAAIAAVKTHAFR